MYMAGKRPSLKLYRENEERGKGERGTGKGERGMGNGESLKRGISKIGNL